MSETLYIDSHWPLPVVDYMTGLLKSLSSDPNAPEIPGSTVSRSWLSQPRVSIDPTVEVVTVRFKIPLSVSEIGWEALRVPSHYEVWYQDRSNNWRQVLDTYRIPITLDVSASSLQSWAKTVFQVYPIVAKAIQFRVNRTPDPQYADQPYYVGIRNTLIKRKIYDRTQGTSYLEDEQDVYGNVISKTIRDWDAPKSVDSQVTTFWKSSPQPDPAAVVSLYLDCRNNDGTPRVVDKLYIDPVYSGQHLNLYYSTDDTIGVRKPCPITIVPTEEENTSWRVQKGRTDDSVNNAESFYRFTGQFGPLIREDVWFGFEWKPDFDPLDGPPQNPILFKSTLVGSSDQYHPTITYDVGAGEFQLELTNGTETRTFTAPPNQIFTPGDTLRVVVGWKYDPSTVYLVVQNQNQVVLALTEEETTLVPDLVSLDGTIEMTNFRGLLTATVVKLEDYTTNSSLFLQNPISYCSPEPVLPDAQGVLPTTTLDNSIYVAPWTELEHGTGGVHETAFWDKEWTPIWRNYVTEKGMLYFPKAITCNYLKLEFSNLTSEPYPVYEPGIDVQYRVFPISASQTSTQGRQVYSAPGGFLGLGTQLSVNGVKSVNWLNPSSVSSALNAIYGKTVDPVMVDVGQGYVTGSLPNMENETIDTRYRLELGSQYVYRRTQLQPYILAQNSVETIIKAEGLSKIAPYTDIPWVDIEAANVGAIQKKVSPGALPMRGTDWWIFPGQTLRIPATVMEKLTESSTVVERGWTQEVRVRFTTTSVHRYDVRTVKRDAAVAYFAGVREVYPLTTTFILDEDKESYDFSLYDSSQWFFNNVKQLETGPVTTDSLFYTIENPLFLTSITNWEQAQGEWSWNPSYGHWSRGFAQVEADSQEKKLLSTLFDVKEGDEISFSGWVRWDGLSVLDDTSFAELTAATYLNETLVEYITLGDGVQAIPWYTRGTSSQWDNAIEGWVRLEGTYTVPDGVNRMRVGLRVTPNAQTGTIGFDSVSLRPDHDTTSTLFKYFRTTSKFSKVKVDFRDSGLVRSNAMWSDVDSSDGLADQLAYYTDTIPTASELQSGMWSDTIKTWMGDNVEWGTPYSVVSISVDGNRQFQNKRALHFYRAGGAGNAGLKVRQWTNIFTGALARLGVVIYKPYKTNNVVTLRLRRLSDGVFVYEESFTPPVGYYYEFQSNFFTIPDDPGPDPVTTGIDYPDEDVYPGTDVYPGSVAPIPWDPHVYEISVTLSGDSEDDVYVNDLYTELAHGRYFLQMGATGMIEVTDLRYKDTTYVTSTVPVNEVSVQVSVLSPKFYCFGATLVPQYLQ